MGEVIEARQWRHPSGRTASVYGSLPQGEGWEIVTTGWTIQHPDGTIGLGRPPFASKAEAQAWVDAHPNFPGMQQD
jgi:hypothetical protein